jgi:hypothetical protein
MNNYLNIENYQKINTIQENFGIFKSIKKTTTDVFTPPEIL